MNRRRDRHHYRLGQEFLNALERPRLAPAGRVISVDPGQSVDSMRSASEAIRVADAGAGCWC
jgi:hypothetical protein